MDNKLDSLHMKSTNNDGSVRNGTNCELSAVGPSAAAQIKATALSEIEKQQMRECEGILREGLSTFFDVGSALLTIREN